MEAFPLAVELVDEGQQLGHQVPLGGKDASGHHLGLHQVEEYFDRVQPRRVGRNEMEGDARMLAEPILDLRRLVATDVVQDHVDSPLRVVGEDAVQEAEEVPGTVPVLALSLNLCRRHVQGCKQLGGAVPFIVMRPPSDLVRPHGQLRLTAVQRLHLRLLIHAKHHGILRRVRVQTHNIDEFLPELGIIGLGERSNSMGAQPRPVEDVPPMARPVTADSLMTRTAKGAQFSTIMRASSSHRSISLSWGTTSWTIPMRYASWASQSSPVKRSLRAKPRGARWVNMVGPLMEAMPRLTWGQPNWARSEAMRKSERRASPPPWADGGNDGLPDFADKGIKIVGIPSRSFGAANIRAAHYQIMAGGEGATPFTSVNVSKRSPSISLLIAFSFSGRFNVT